MKSSEKPLQMGALGQKFPEYEQPQMVDGHTRPVQAGSLPQGFIAKYPNPPQMG